MFLMISQLKWLIAKRQKLSKYTPTTNSYNFAKKVWSLKVYNTIIYKIRKTPIEPCV
jgi:hypothetical protein